MYVYIYYCVCIYYDTHAHTSVPPETLRATMAKSSLESLRRRTKVEFSDMLYMGPESRVCRELSSLGITCKR